MQLLLLTTIFLPFLSAQAPGSEQTPGSDSTPSTVSTSTSTSTSTSSTTTTTTPDYTAQCGGRTNAQTRIIGGVPLETTNNFPWSVSLQAPMESQTSWMNMFRSFDGSIRHFCGGAVVNDRWILTAAHCVMFADPNFPLPLPIRFNINNAIAIVGHVNTSKENHDNIDDRYKFKFLKIVYQYCFMIGYYDVALIRVNRSFSEVFDLTGQNPVWPVCLPEQEEEFDLNRQFELAGWGLIDRVSKPADVLHTAIFDDFDHDDCWWLSLYYFMGFGRIGPDLICAYNYMNASACKGDSGSSLVQAKLVNNEEAFTSYGITSFGFGVSIIRGGCDTRMPMAFTKTSAYRNWIDLQLQTYGNISDETVAIHRVMNENGNCDYPD